MLAKCIKETYTWEGDGEQHSFCRVQEGHVYAFDKIDDEYWVDITHSPNKEDLALDNGCFGCAKGLESKYFHEMFEIIQ